MALPHWQGFEKELHTKKTDAEHLAEFKTDGYTLFENVYDAETMQQWQEKFRQMQDEGGVDNPSGWFGNMVERAPTLMLPSVPHLRGQRFLPSYAREGGDLLSYSPGVQPRVFFTAALPFQSPGVQPRVTDETRSELLSHYRVK